MATKKRKITASENHVIVQVLKDYQGMTRELKKGDIIEVPERQAKPGCRNLKDGLYKLYTKGDKKPMHR